MFSGSLFGGFNDDQFFEDSPMRMRQPFGMMDPFNMGFDHRRALTGPSRHPQQQQQQQQHGNAMALRNNMMTMLPFGGGSLFDSMLGQFDQMSNNPNAHMYSSSTVMSFSSMGNGGQPQMYQASQTTRTAPGGVKETRKQVQDSASGLKKMSVNHQIGEKSHSIEKIRNVRTDEEEEIHNIVNMDEDDTDQFELEWNQCTRPHNSHRGRHNLSSQLPPLGITYDVGAQRPAAPKNEKRPQKYDRYHHGDGEQIEHEPVERDGSVRQQFPLQTSHRHHHRSKAGCEPTLYRDRSIRQHSSMEVGDQDPSKHRYHEEGGDGDGRSVRRKDRYHYSKHVQLPEEQQKYP